MKYVLYCLVLCFVVFFCATSIYAAVDRQPKTVRGKVLLPNGSVAQNAHVTISCKSFTLTDTTSRYGNYEVTFGELQCEQFDTVHVQVQFNTWHATASKEVQYFNGVNMPDILLTEEVPVSVPEFGMLSAIIASSSSLLVFTKLRKYR